MVPKAGYVTSMIHVADMALSLRFYSLLGFDVIDTQGEPPGWARLHCEGGAIMLLAAEEPLEPGHGVLLYMYTPDLPSLRGHLLANGLAPSPVRRPDYMKSGEIRVEDPDGNVVLVGHWGKLEHAEWERHLAERKAGLEGREP
jgi:hypothetical protein